MERMDPARPVDKQKGNRLMKHNLATRITYPSLFQPSGIEFDLQEAAVVTVTITNEAGTTLETPVNRQHYEKGTHAVAFALPTRQTGGIFYSITAEMAGEAVSERKKLH